MAHKIITSFKNSVANRIIVIAIIAFAMAIPLNMVSSVVNERNFYYDSVIREISSLWGKQQTLAGPILVIPFIEKHETEEQLQSGFGRTETKRKTDYVRKHVFLLPKTLNFNSNLKEHYRQRGIYRSLVYSSKIDLSASFEPLKISELADKVDEILVHEARILIGLSDTKAVDKIDRIEVNKQGVEVIAGVGTNELLSSGFSAKLPDGIDFTSANHFNISFDIKGSHGLHFAPIGETTVAKMVSSWPHPKFSGQLLPDSHEINERGFTAVWEIPHLVRNYPQAWVKEHRKVDLYELVAGVSLFEPVFIYSKITRAVKYGLLFIVLTFITFFVFESSATTPLHYVQYGMVGTALAFFYLLLLALSEHIDFGLAYLMGAITCISMISVYVGYAFKSRRRGAGLFVLLGVLFGLIYTLLKAEDFALLTGTLLLLLSMAGLMFVTKDLNAANLEASSD